MKQVFKIIANDKVVNADMFLAISVIRCTIFKLTGKWKSVHWESPIKFDYERMIDNHIMFTIGFDKGDNHNIYATDEIGSMTKSAWNMCKEHYLPADITDNALDKQLTVKELITTFANFHFADVKMSNRLAVAHVIVCSILPNGKNLFNI